MVMSYAESTTSREEPRHTRSCSTASWGSCGSSTRPTSRTSTTRRLFGWNDRLIGLGRPRKRRGRVAGRAHQHVVVRVLQHATGPQSARCIADVHVERVHNDTGVGKLAGDPLEDLEPPRAGHLVIEDDDVWHELLATANGLLGIARYADALHVALGVHQIAEVLADRRMIVDHQDPDRSPKHRRPV